MTQTGTETALQIAVTSMCFDGGFTTGLNEFLLSPRMTGDIQSPAPFGCYANPRRPARTQPSSLAVAVAVAAVEVVW